MSVTVIRKDALPPARLIFIGGCGIGLLGLLTMFLGCVAVASLEAYPAPKLVFATGLILVTSFVAAMPIWALFRLRRQVVSYHRAGLASIGFALGFAGFFPTALAARFFADGLNVSGWQLISLSILGGPLAAYVVGASLWGVVRFFTGPVVYGDANSCLGCGYTLVGCESSRCPECGQPFTTPLPAPDFATPEKPISDHAAY